MFLQACLLLAAGAMGEWGNLLTIRGCLVAKGCEGYYMNIIISSRRKERKENSQFSSAFPLLKHVYCALRTVDVKAPVWR